MLAGALNNISVYWVAYGKKLAQVALCNGGNDLVGTAFSEEIYRAAGKPTNSSLVELSNLVKEINRNPIQRNTFFPKDVLHAVQKQQKILMKQLINLMQSEDVSMKILNVKKLPWKV